MLSRHLRAAPMLKKRWYKLCKMFTNFNICCFYIKPVPSAVNISEGCSNNTVISATWTIPNSVVDTFDIMCSAGTASPASIPLESSPTSDTFTASCTELPTPGLEYNLSVVAISNNKQSAIQTVGVHACKFRRHRLELSAFYCRRVVV